MDFIIIRLDKEKVLEFHIKNHYLLLDLIKKNPTIKQQELADITDKSIRSVKRIMKSLQDKNYIRRESGKRYGKWEVII